jgi:hypothetical protein
LKLIILFITWTMYYCGPSLGVLHTTFDPLTTVCLWTHNRILAPLSEAHVALAAISCVSKMRWRALCWSSRECMWQTTTWPQSNFYEGTSEELLFWSKMTYVASVWKPREQALNHSPSYTRLTRMAQSWNVLVSKPFSLNSAVSWIGGSHRSLANIYKNFYINIPGVSWIVSRQEICFIISNSCAFRPTVKGNSWE